MEWKRTPIPTGAAAAGRRSPGTLFPGRAAPLLPLLVGALGLVALAGCGDDADRVLVENACSRCHSPEVALQVKGRSLEEWQRVVETMRRRGAAVTDGEAERIARYLAKRRED